MHRATYYYDTVVVALSIVVQLIIIFSRNETPAVQSLHSIPCTRMRTTARRALQVLYHANSVNASRTVMYVAECVENGSASVVQSALHYDTRTDAIC